MYLDSQETGIQFSLQAGESIETEKKDACRTEDYFSKLSFVIVSHVSFTGHAQELENFLKTRCQRLMFIGHPFSHAAQKKSTAKMYERDKLTSTVELPQIKGPEFLVFFKDFLATFLLCFKFKTKFHIYVGADPLNALAGLLLKRLGFANKVIFYVIDYVPHRFSNSILNGVYRWIDKVCVSHADFTWNLTYAMTEAREAVGIKKEKTNQMVVPTGTHVEEITHLPFDNIIRTDIAFLSHLRKNQGIELILDALPDVVKDVPSMKLLVIGTGPLEHYFKAEVRRLGLEKHVLFMGYIEDHREIEHIISKCGVGLAPYVPDSDSFTWYADPGKPKVYLGCGLPVVITKVPRIACEISNYGAGIAINYDKNELTAALVKLLKNKNLQRQYHEKALEFASKNTWNQIFSQTFDGMFNARQD